MKKNLKFGLLGRFLWCLESGRFGSLPVLNRKVNVLWAAESQCNIFNKAGRAGAAA